MKINAGFDIELTEQPLGFRYGADTFGPPVENRSLNAIRASLMDPDCDGPETVYAIALDVGKKKDLDRMKERNLLFGAVAYAKGFLGKETVHSQGHIHAVSSSCGMSTCEVYEIWTGEAYIYMQESGDDDPGRCYAVYGRPGDVIIVPPGWVHATIVADPLENLSFGAWCVRDYGFEYEAVRRHHGTAWSYIFEEGKPVFRPNPAYKTGTLNIVSPRTYSEFHLKPGKPIYTQFEEDPDAFLFVSQPQNCLSLWEKFEP